MSNYIFSVLQRKMWIVIFIAAAVGAATYFLTRDIHRKYKSTAQLSAGFPDRQSVLISNTANQNQRFDLQNHTEAMKTEFIGLMVSYNLLLHDLKEDMPFRGFGLMPLSPAERNSAKVILLDKLDSFSTLSGYDRFENKLMRVLDEKQYNVSTWINDEDLRVERIGDTNFIRVEFLSENPALSAFVVNTLCSEYIRYNSYLNNPVSDDSVQYFSDLTEKKKKELEIKTEQLNRYQSTNKNRSVESDGALTEYEINLREEEIKVNRLSASLRNINAKIADYDDPSDNTKESIDPKSSPKVAELQLKIDELNKIYSNTGSKDKKLETTIANLRNQLQSEMARLEAQPTNTGKAKLPEELLSEKRKIESEYKRSESNLLSLRSIVYRLRKDNPKVNSNTGQPEIASIEHERDRLLKEYTTASKKLEDAESRQPKEQGNSTGLKLMVMGQPNAEPESLSSLSFVVIASVVSGLLTSIIISISTYIRTSRRPINPTFVVTRSTRSVELKKI